MPDFPPTVFQGENLYVFPCEDTLMAKNRPQQQPIQSRSIKPTRPAPDTLATETSPDLILALQQSVGNHAVQRLLRTAELLARPHTTAYAGSGNQATQRLLAKTSVRQRGENAHPVVQRFVEPGQAPQTPVYVTVGNGDFVQGVII